MVVGWARHNQRVIKGTDDDINVREETINNNGRRLFLYRIVILMIINYYHNLWLKIKLTGNLVRIDPGCNRYIHYNNSRQVDGWGDIPSCRLRT